jgi:hypothetical protein
MMRIDWRNLFHTVFFLFVAILFYWAGLRDSGFKQSRECAKENNVYSCHIEFVPDKEVK